MKTAKIFIAKRGGVFLAALHFDGRISVGSGNAQIDCVLAAVDEALQLGADRVELIDRATKGKAGK